MQVKKTETKPSGKSVLILSILAAVVAAVIITCIMAGKNKKYNLASEALKEERLKDAYILFEELGSFKDSIEKKQDIESINPAYGFMTAEENDTVTLGSFEQDGENGEDDLEWIVLDKRKDRMLLLSKYIITCMPYNEQNKDITWEECSLRRWLNETFTDSAFTEKEKQVILEVSNKNQGNDLYGTMGGNETNDMVFLLSEEEARAYLHEERARLFIGMGEPTAVAVKEGVAVTETEKTDGMYSPWWLRSPGVYQNSALFVGTDGTVYTSGAILDNKNYCGVRPAMWVLTLTDN